MLYEGPQAVASEAPRAAGSGGSCGGRGGGCSSPGVGMAATSRAAAIINIGFRISQLISCKMASDRWLADAPAATGVFQHLCLGRFRQGGSSAPSRFQSREPRLQGCYRRPALPCHLRPAGAVATGAAHQHCRLRAACATGAVAGACYRRPVLPCLSHRPVRPL